MPSPSLLQRLKERKLVQWALAYLAGAAVFLGVLDAVAEPLSISLTVYRAILVLVVTGFFVVLVLAWYHGEKGYQKLGGTEVLLLASLVVLAGTTIFLIRSGQSEADHDQTRILPLTGLRVAVLPPANRTGDESLEPIGLQASDLIREGLARAERVQDTGPMAELRVLPFGSTSRPSDSSDLTQAWTEETDADMAVLGAFYSNGDSLRFHLEVRARDGTVLAPVDLVVSSTDPAVSLSRLQTRTLGAVAGIVAPGHEWVFATEGRQAPTLEALEALEQGWVAHERARQAAEAPPAIRHFQRAVELDSAYLVPLIELAGVYAHFDALATVDPASADSVCQILESRSAELSQWQRLISEMACLTIRGHRGEAIIRARLSTQFSPSNWYYAGFHAMALNRPREAVNAFARYDPNLDRGARVGAPTNLELWALAHHMLGEHDRELELLRERTEKFPDATEILAGEARGLIAAGRLDEAQAMIDEWESNLLPGWNPRDHLNAAANEFEAHGDTARARLLWTRALDWDSRRPQEELETSSSKGWRAMCLTLSNRLDEAEELAASVAQTNGDIYQSYGVFLLGIISARRGDKETAQRHADALRDWGGPMLRERLTLWRSMIAANMGDSDEAVRLLERAVEEGHIMWRRRPDHEPFFKPIWGHPDFQEFVRPKG